MAKKLRILSVISALCFLGSIACFSGYAVESVNNPLEDNSEEIIAVDPGTIYVDSGNTYEDTDTVISTYVDPITPAYVESENTYVDPGSTYEDSDYIDLISSNTTNIVSYYQPDSDDYTYNTTSYYADYTSQYNQYVENTYQAKYDDNYYYIPSYTEPEENLIDVESKEVDTDELTQDDWAKIMLALSDSNDTEKATQTFNFIKNNTEEGDTSVDWMLYLGIVLIFMAMLTVVFVVITTNKANDKISFA